MYYIVQYISILYCNVLYIIKQYQIIKLLDDFFNFNLNVNVNILILKEKMWINHSDNKSQRKYSKI